MLNLVTALRCEADPLIAHLGMTAAAAGPFPIYRADDIWLIVSGVGKTASAAATTMLYGQRAAVRDQAWLNVGLAGHADAPLGEVLLAHKIRDVGSDAVWYPPLLTTPPCATVCVRTVDRVERRYADGAAYEMEAAGFYPTACRLTTAELALVLKVVSDNLQTPPEQINAARARALIEGCLPVVDRLLDDLRELASETAPPPLLEEDLELFGDRWRFSVTQLRQLKRLLYRWQSLSDGHSAWNEELDGLADSAAVIRHLTQRLEALALARMA